MTSELFRDLQLIISGPLVTMIWMIQILHYPMFSYLDKEYFPEAMRFHQKRITYLVVPLMVIELLMSIYSLATKISLINILSLGCVMAIWASTFFIQVPIHSKLKSYDERLISSLIKGNYIRTSLWTFHFLLLGLSQFGQ